MCVKGARRCQDAGRKGRGGKGNERGGGGSSLHEAGDGEHGAVRVQRHLRGFNRHCTLHDAQPS